MQDLQGRRHQEVLLLETQLLALKHLPWLGTGCVWWLSYIVVGVQDTGDVLGEIAIKHSLDVVAVVD